MNMLEAQNTLVSILNPTVCLPDSFVNKLRRVLIMFERDVSD